MVEVLVIYKLVWKYVMYWFKCLCKNLHILLSVGLIVWIGGHGCTHTVKESSAASELCTDNAVCIDGYSLHSQ